MIDLAEGEAAVIAGLRHARSYDHEYIQITVGMRTPSNWDCVRILPGTPALTGRCIGSTWPGEFLFDVKVVDAQAWLDGRSKKENG